MAATIMQGVRAAVRAYASARGREAAEKPVAQEGALGWADPSRLFPGDKWGAQYNPGWLVTWKGMDMIDDMRRDDQIRAAMKFKKQAIVATGWTVKSPDGQPDDWEPTEFVRWNLQTLRGTFEACLMEVMSALDYGYSVTEKLWALKAHTPFGPRAVLDSLVTLRPHEIRLKATPDGALESVVQRQGGKDLELPLEKVFVFTHEKEFGNWYGRTDLEPAYRAWWTKRNAYKWMAMLLEKFGIPPVFAMYDPNRFKGKQLDEIKEILSHIAAGTVGVIPAPGETEVYKNKSVDFYSPQLAKQGAEVFTKAIDSLNADIARALLMPGLVGLTPEQQSGSFARARVNFDVFMLVAEALRSALREAVVQEQLIEPLVALNYNTNGEYPQFEFEPLTDERRLDLLDTWAKLCEAKSVHTTTPDEKHIREVLDFPEFEQEELLTPDTGTDLPEAPEEDGEEDTPQDTEGQDAGGEDTGKAAEKKPGAQGDAAPPAPPRKNAVREHDALVPPDSADGGMPPEGVSRAPNMVEQNVNWQALAADLDALEESTTEAAAAILKRMRDAVVADVRKMTAAQRQSAARTLNNQKLKYQAELRNAFTTMLRTAFGMGVDSMKDELAIAREMQSDIYVRPNDALEYLKTKAFWMTGVTSDRVVETVRSSLIRGIEYAWDTEQIVDDIVEQLDPWTGNPDVLRDGKPVQPWRLATVVRTNTTDAINHGRLMQGNRAKRYVQGWEYAAILDSHTTPVCRHLDGRIFKPGDPDLERLRPPRHHNCRSVLVPVTIATPPVAQESWITAGQKGKAFELSGKGFGG